MQIVFDIIRNWMNNPELEKESVNVSKIGETDMKPHDSNYFINQGNLLKSIDNWSCGVRSVAQES